jgi:DnaA family protein
MPQFSTGAPAQLSLPVHLPDDETFSNYVSECGDEVVLLLQALGAQPQLCRRLFLSGSSGAGKTHLLHAACGLAAETGLRASYLPMKAIREMSPRLLDSLEHFDLVCVDDIDLVAGQAVWELALFDFYNRVQETGTGNLVMTAKASPRQCGFQLPDLISRLDWGSVIKLEPLSDDGKLTALIRRAHHRGVLLPPESARFLLNRTSRNMRDLYQSLDTLLSASLQQQRQPTIPFLKQVLSL